MSELWSLYQKELRQNPLRTKSLTAGVIGALGELISQFLIARRSGTKPSGPSTDRWRRLAVFFCFGAAVSGPVFHTWYGLLSRWTESIKNPQLKVIVQLFLDRGVLTPPLLLFTLTCLSYFLSKEATFQSAKTHALTVFRGALRTNYSIFLPTQAISFAFIPLEYRVLFGNLVALLWNVQLALFSQGK